MSTCAERRQIPLATALASTALSSALALCSGGRALAQDTPPDVLVKNVTLEVLQIVGKDADIQAGDRAKTIALVEEKIVPHFNTMRMAAQAVAVNWPKASAEQKVRIADEFKTLLVRTYASAITAYRDKRFDFRPLRAQPTDTEVTVAVRVLQPGTQPVMIEYDLEKTAAGWKAWDVRVGGISLVLNYRTEFANVVRDSGIDGLISSIAAKNRAPAPPPEAKK